jgi:hypothetical protein
MSLTFTRRFSAVVMVGFTGVVLAVAQAPVAAGSVPVSQANASAPGQDACKGKPKGHIVKTYTLQAPYAPAPLRCGTSDWGFNHLKKRWSSDFDDSIQAALTFAEKKRDAREVGNLCTGGIAALSYGSFPGDRGIRGLWLDRT